MKNLFSFLLLFLAVLAGCSSRGCASSESFTVIYRGNEALEERAPVVRAGVAEGYIREALKGAGAARIVVNVRQAATFTDQDRFRVFKDEAGRLGFRVEPGDGKPLQAGDEVEADPSWNKRLYYAAMTAPGGITLPSGAFIPYPAALTKEPKTVAERRREDFGKKIGKELRKPKGFELRVNKGLESRYDALSKQLEGKHPEEALAILNTEAPPLLEALAQEEQEADLQNDGGRERDARNLQKRIQRAIQKAEREKKQLERRAARPQKERWIPPELR